MAARPVNRRPRSARAAGRPADPASVTADPLADTIVAISTPPGRGGIGVVRLSGPRAAEIGRRLFRPAAGASSTTGTSSTTDGSSGIAIDSSAAERPRFGTLRGRDGGPIDHGYLVEFRPDRAFTREPTAEIWAHGSPAALREIVEAAVAAGARPATPGEFTMRAFLHGRIDATQAEAIRDLIEARTLFQARVAHAQAMGAIGDAVEALKDFARTRRGTNILRYIV